MGLEDTNSIDLIAKPLPGDSCKLVLYVVDDGGVTDEIRRYKLLIEKLVTCVHYVAEPAFQEEHPGVGFADVLVRVLCRRPPNDAMTEVQAVGAKGDAANRLKVAFADYEEFLASMNAK